MKAKIDEFETNGKIKNIRQMILRRVINLELIKQMMRRVIWLQNPTVFWLGRRTNSLSY
jgi:gentisate 1,2-dioxygenase